VPSLGLTKKNPKFASGPVFMFCAPGHVFGSTEGVGSHFHVSRARTHFRRKRGCRVPFSCFALTESFPAVPRASGPVFKFCAPRLVSEVPRASGPIFMFCAPGLVFGGTEGVESRFHVLRARTHFRRYRGRWVSFSCIAIPDTFSAVRRASGLVFTFCAPGYVIDGVTGIRSHFHILRFRTRFRWYRGRRVPFSCFVLPDSFSAVPSASGPVFMFCAHGYVFGGTEGVGSRFPVLRTRTHFRLYRGRRFPF
jgi:hypothetical protein